MRADDDIDAPVAQALERLALLGRRAKAGEHLDGDRVVRHALAEVVVVLLREHGGRHEDGDLLAAHHRLERGADRDLGFAEADVAADEPIHRAARSPCRPWSRRWR